MSSLSVIVPVYNEVNTLKKVLDDILSTIGQLDIFYEVIVVNDGSSDGSENVNVDFVDNDKIYFLNHKMNRGYGKAIESGIQHAQNEWIVIIPSDDQFIVSELEKMWIQRKSGNIICGARKNRKDSFQRKVISKMYNLTTNVILGFSVVDIGWIKLYEKEFIQQIKLETHGFIIDTEIMLKASKKDYGMINVYVEHRERIHGESKIKLNKYWGIIRDMVKILKMKYGAM